MDIPRLYDRLLFLRTDSRGATAVEFALILPILVLLLGGTIEGGLLFYTWGNMEHVGRQAARAVAVGEFTREQAEDFITRELHAAIGAPEVEKLCICLPESGTWECGPCPQDDEPKSIDDSVLVAFTIPADQLSRLQPFGVFRSIDLSTKIVVHLENAS